MADPKEAKARRFWASFGIATAVACALGAFPETATLDIVIAGAAAGLAYHQVRKDRG